MGVIRVTGGAWRGRRLRTPRGDGTRPSSDAYRESVLQLLGERVAGARVLDLFAGSGALGLECLSRGAAEVIGVAPRGFSGHVIGARACSIRCASSEKIPLDFIWTSFGWICHGSDCRICGCHIFHRP